MRGWEGRELSIWHIALSKWYLHMHRNHSDFFAIYFYLLRKVNFLAINADLQQRLAEHHSFMYAHHHAANCRTGWNCTTSTCSNANSASNVTARSRNTSRLIASCTSS